MAAWRLGSLPSVCRGKGAGAVCVEINAWLLSGTARMTSKSSLMVRENVEAGRAEVKASLPQCTEVREVGVENARMRTETCKALDYLSVSPSTASVENIFNDPSISNHIVVCAK